MSDSGSIKHPAERLALSVDDAGRILGVSRDLVYDLVAPRHLAAVRPDRRVLVPRWAIDEVLSRPQG